MKKIDILIREFSLNDKKIITSDELEEACNKYNFDFKKTKVSLQNKKSIITIFERIYYIKDHNEKKTNVIQYSTNELLSEGLRLKNICNWYFGLNTALKVLNKTHEIFATSYVINDTFNRMNPMTISGSKFSFVKIKPSLFSFGIKKMQTSNNIELKYSNLEKTLLDMSYLYLKSGKSKNIVIDLILEYKKEIDSKRLQSFFEYYPKTLQKIISEIIE